MVAVGGPVGSLKNVTQKQTPNGSSRVPKVFQKDIHNEAKRLPKGILDASLSRT